MTSIFQPVANPEIKYNQVGTMEEILYIFLRCMLLLVY